jgi:hypothetical protein
VLLPILGESVDGVVVSRVLRWVGARLTFVTGVEASGVQLFDELAVSLGSVLALGVILRALL